MNRLAFFALVTAVAFAAPLAAAADPGFRAGHTCLESTSGTTGLSRGAASGMYILHADTAVSKSLMCPVTIDTGTINPTSARVTVYDTSSVDDVACTPYVQDDAVITGLGTRYSCATVGGCTTANVAWSTGTATLTWADTIAAISGELAAVFSCNLGRVDSAEIMKLEHYELAY